MGVAGGVNLEHLKVPHGRNVYETIGRECAPPEVARHFQNTHVLQGEPRLSVCLSVCLLALALMPNITVLYLAILCGEAGCLHQQVRVAVAAD